MRVTIYAGFSLTREITAERHNWFLKLVQPVLQSEQRFLFNQSGAKPKPVAYVAYARFPALGGGHMFLFRVLIGLLRLF